MKISCVDAGNCDGASRVVLIAVDQSMSGEIVDRGVSADSTRANTGWPLFTAGATKKKRPKALIGRIISGFWDQWTYHF